MPHELRRTDNQSPPGDRASDAAADSLLDIANGQISRRQEALQYLRAGLAAIVCRQRLCDRMGRMSFQGGDQRPHRLVAAPGNHRDPASRERARLVQQHHALAAEGLKDLAALDEDMPPGGPTDGDGHRQRRGQPQGARASDDEQCHGVVDGLAVGADPTQ